MSGDLAFIQRGLPPLTALSPRSTNDFATKVRRAQVQQSGVALNTSRLATGIYVVRGPTTEGIYATKVTIRHWRALPPQQAIKKARRQPGFFLVRTTPAMYSSPTSHNDALLALRPAIEGQPPAIPTPATVADFQHQVLRPLLKLQHATLLATVADFAADYRLPLAGAAPGEVQRLLGELLARNARLRATIAGLVVGLLTTAELDFYRQHRAELNRRLLDLAEQRVLSSY